MVSLCKKIESRLQDLSFPQPESDSIKVWRFMDISKFLWLIAEKKLYFTRLDQLQDNFEGSPTRGTLDSFRNSLKSQSQEQQKKWMEHVSYLYRKSRERMYVNCWFSGNKESEAMWRLYCPNHNGVAIQTTYSKLKGSIADDERINIGEVTYADYESHSFSPTNLYYPAMHKRIAFRHENEVRLVCKMRSTKLNPKIDWP